MTEQIIQKKYARFDKAGKCVAVYDYVADIAELTEITQDQCKAVSMGAVLMLDGDIVRERTKQELADDEKIENETALKSMTVSQAVFYEFAKSNEEEARRVIEQIKQKQTEDFYAAALALLGDAGSTKPKGL